MRMQMSRAGAVTLLAMLGLAATVWMSDSDGRAQVPPGKVKVIVKAPPAPVPVVEAGSLMRLFNKPLYTHLKEAMAEEPSSPEDWATIQERGLQAAEVANLVAMRKAKPPQGQWLEGAFNLQQAGLTLAKAAEAKDWDATVRAYEGVIQQCNNCHKARAPGKAPVLKP